MGFLAKLFGRNQNSKENIRLDHDGQPIPAINVAAREIRNVNEMLGLLQGITADDLVSPEEIAYLGKWLVTNPEFSARWPFNELAARVDAILRAGRVTAADQAALLALIQGITGRRAEDEVFENTPAPFPLTDPAPSVIFADREFVLTGKFRFGARKECEAAIVARGGRCADSVRLRSMHYLVIGTSSSRDWATNAWGNKIRKAAEYAARGLDTYPIYIISEDHWVAALNANPPSA